MTGVQFTNLIRKYTGTNSTTFPDSDIVIFANAVKDDFAEEIIKADEGYFGVPQTRDLVASDSSDFTKREYSLPDDFLAMERVEAALNGTDWVRLKEFNLPDYKRPTTEAKTTANFSNVEGECYYDIFRKSLWIYSGTITAGTDTLKLWSIVYPADITTDTLAQTSDLSIDPSSTTSAIPRPFHELWARKVSILWKGSKDKPVPLTEHELSFEVDFKKKISAITNPNKDRSITASLPDDEHLQDVSNLGESIYDDDTYL